MFHDFRHVAKSNLRNAGNSPTVIIMKASGHKTMSMFIRGTSRREDVLDTVITMKRPTGCKAQDGACIEVYFEKNRALYGDDVKPFEARLESNTNDDGIKH